MPYCSILECKNDSRRKNIINGGVSYHRFPKDPNVKERWIDATGRVNWMPTKSSTICSEHFLEDDLLISNKGYRYTKSTALPTLKIINFIDELQNVKDAVAVSSERQCDAESSETQTQPVQKSLIKKGCVKIPKVEPNILQNHDEVVPVQLHCADCKIFQSEREIVKCVDKCSNCSRPRQKKLKGQLKFCEDKIKKQSLKIKQLQSQNQRLRRKINNITEMLTRLEERFILTEKKNEEDSILILVSD